MDSALDGYSKKQSEIYSPNGSNAAGVKTCQLIKPCSQTGKLKIISEGLAMLRDLPSNQPLVVICMVGLYRSGKSFLLNQYAKWLGFSSGFQIGNTTRSCTRGVWMTIIEQPDHSSIVLLDTEGLSSIDQDESYDCKIFALGLLLSSYFVYNSVGVIDEAAIDRLHIVGNIAQSVSKNNKLRFSMLWVLRDFALKLGEFEGDPDAYLEHALSEKGLTRNKRPDASSKRTDIRRVFAGRSCRMLVRPSNDETALQNLANLTPDDLRPEFLNQADSLFQLITENSSNKRLHGELLDGAAFAAFCEHCVKEMNSKGIPDIAETFDYVCECSYRDIMSKAEKLYDEKMREACRESSTWFDFVMTHETVRGQAMALFHEPGVFASPKKSCFIDKLNVSLRQKIEDFWQLAKLQSSESSKGFVLDSLVNLDKGECVDQVFSDAAISSACLGPEKYKVLFQALLNDVIKLRMQKQMEGILAENSTKSELIDAANFAVDDMKRNLGSVESALTLSKDSLEKEKLKNEELTKQLDDALEDRLQAEERLKPALVQLETLRESDQQFRLAIQERDSALARDECQLASLQQSLNSCEAENELVRREINDLVSAVEIQQERFDDEMEQMAQSNLELEVLAFLNETIWEIQCWVSETEKQRIEEERLVLKSQLSTFHQRASTLPNWLQEYF